MSIVFGTHLYGMVDRIRGTCHVRTTFAHVMFFPILPLQTFLVVEGGRGEPDRAHPISKSLKSVVLAAVRAFLLLGFLVTASVLLERPSKDKPGARPLNGGEMICGLIGLGFLGIFFASYPLSRPGAQRRAYLLQLVDVARGQESPVPGQREGGAGESP